MRFSFVAGETLPAITEEDLTPEEITELLTPSEGTKDGLAFIPATFSTPYRKDEVVTEVTALVVDFDDVPDADFDEVVTELQERGLACWYYETYRHRPGSGVTRGRVVLPLAQPVPAAKWRGVWAALLADLGITQHDPTCGNPSRLYFLPRHPAGETRAFEYVPGDPLDWTHLLVRSETTPKAKSVTQPGENKPASPGVLAAAEEHVATYRKARPTHKGTGNADAVAVGGILLNDWALTLEEALPIAERHNRLTFNPRGTEELETCLQNGARYASNPYGAKRFAFELAARGVTRKRPATTPQAEEYPEGFTGGFAYADLRSRLEGNRHALVARILKGKALSRSVSTRATWTNALYALTDALAGEPWPVEMLMLLVEPSWSRDNGGLHREELLTLLTEAQAGAVGRLEAREVRHTEIQRETAASMLAKTDAPESGEWLMPLLDEKGIVPKGHHELFVIEALRHSVRWEGLTFDTFQQEYFLNDRRVSVDILVAEFMAWASSMNVPLAVHAFARQLHLIAEERAFDSLIAHYDALPKWDGVERLGTLVGPEGLIRSDMPELAYAREVVRRWLVAGVARAYRPGCKADCALVLMSEQGAAKTSFFEHLHGESKYLSLSLHASEKARKLKGRHIVELNELSSAEHSVDEVKAFLSERADSDRVVYARSYETLPRRCIFGGSTNRARPLQDETGGRRFWLVQIERVELEEFLKVRAQVLAEAKAVFFGAKECCDPEERLVCRCTKHRWWIGPDEPGLVLEAAEVAKDFTEWQPFEQLITSTLLRLAPEQRPEYITATWVFDCVEISPGVKLSKSDYGVANRIGRALRKICGQPIRRRVDQSDFNRESCYRVPSRLLAAPQKGRSTASTAQLKALPGGVTS